MKKSAPAPIETAPAAAVEPALERAILANLASDDGFMVYADWLQQQGDVRGELAAIQARLQVAPKNRKLHNAAQKLIWEHRAQFFGPLAPALAKKPSSDAAILATWRHGFIDALELSAYEAFDESDGANVRRVEPLILALPEVTSLKFLRELTIARPVINDEYHFGDTVKALAKVLPALPALRRLAIGKFEYTDTEISWTKLGQLDALWPVAGALEYLKLRAGSMSLGAVSAPRLRELRIETGGLDRKTLAQVITGKLPHLETLNLWIGKPYYGANVTVPDLLPLLERRNFPRLRHLGIANTVYGDELCAYLPTATILPQLQSLDLSRSHLTLVGIRQLAAHARAFAHLASIDVSECLLDRSAIQLAKTLGPNVNVVKQEDASRYRADDRHEDSTFGRYVAVGE